jgi:hypothetical protein
MSANASIFRPDTSILLINQQNGWGMAAVNKANFWLIVAFGVRSEGSPDKSPWQVGGRCAIG